MRIVLIYVIHINNFILGKALNPLRLKEVTELEGEGENVEVGRRDNNNKNIQGDGR